MFRNILTLIALSVVLVFGTAASVLDENTQWLDTDGEPIVNGSVYIGTKDADPEVSPITIYSDRELTTPLANPQTTDSYGRSTNKIWVPGRYSIKVEDSLGNQKYIDLDAGESADTGITALTNVLGTNAITAEGVPTITAYTDKGIYSFTVVNANTGAVTLNIDGVAAKSLKRMDDGEELASGELQVDQIVNAQYNSEHDIFEWLNMPKSVTGPASAVTSGNVPSFNGTSGVKIQDSGTAAADVVTGPASATANNAAIFNGTTGKIIKQPTTSPTAGDLFYYDTTNGGDWMSGARVKVFSSTDSWTAPYTGSIFIRAWGGGGGGGGGNAGSGQGGGGGGSGRYLEGFVSVTAGTSYTATINSGGGGGAANTTGTTGGSATFGSLVDAGGGAGGQNGSAGGAGGAAGTAATSPSTSIGDTAFAGTAQSGGTGGTGGGSPYHSSLNNSSVAGGGVGGAPGTAGAFPGAGGGGGNSGGSASGGNGAPPLIIIYF